MHECWGFEMATVIDVNELIHAYLSAQANVTAEVSSYIYGPPGLPLNFAPRKAIYYEPEGGPGNAYIPMFSQRFMFKCYGATVAEAMAVWRALFDALHREGRTTVAVTGGNAIIRHGELDAGPTALLEPDLGWPLVWSAFRLVFSERLLS